MAHTGQNSLFQLIRFHPRQALLMHQIFHDCHDFPRTTGRMNQGLTASRRKERCDRCLHPCLDGIVDHSFHTICIHFEGEEERRVFQEYVRDTCLCLMRHKHVYLARQIMPRTMSKPRSGARLSACTAA
jgi:hypothetical protein